MSWAGVTWAYKDLITSAKLAQMQENVRTHDHRSDGSQGDPTSIISGPTFGAAAATLTNGVQSTIGNIVLPATTRKSTLWLEIAGAASTAFQRNDVAITPVDSRLSFSVFGATGSAYVTVLLAASPAGLGMHYYIGIPIAVGAATGTSMPVKVTPQGGNLTECRLQWWVDS